MLLWKRWRFTLPSPIARMDSIELMIAQLQRIAPRDTLECQMVRDYVDRLCVELLLLRKALAAVRCRALVLYNPLTALVPAVRAEKWSATSMTRMNVYAVEGQPCFILVSSDGTCMLHDGANKDNPDERATNAAAAASLHWNDLYPKSHSLWLNSLYGVSPASSHKLCFVPE